MFAARLSLSVNALNPSMRALVWTRCTEECREGGGTEDACRRVEGNVREGEATLATSGLELAFEVEYGTGGGRSVRSTARPAVDICDQPGIVVLVEVEGRDDSPRIPVLETWEAQGALVPELLTAFGVEVGASDDDTR